MKKALIVLLILAVAGGLFAQTTVKVTGSVQTGFAVGLTDEEGDAGKPKVDYIRNRGEHGMRADIGVQVRSGADNSPYGLFGADATLRARETSIFATDSSLTQGLNAPTANVFWQPNSAAWLQIGTGGGDIYDVFASGAARDFDLFDSNGLKLRLTPIEGLDIGAQAYYGTPAYLFENMDFGFAVKYTAADLVAVLAKLRYFGKDGGGIGEDNNVDFSASANFLGLSGLGLTKLAADVGTFGLGTDDFFLGIGEKVGFTAAGLSLAVGAQQYMWMGDGDTALSMPMQFMAEVGYKVSDLVSVGIEGRYNIGAKPKWSGNNQYRNAGELDIDWKDAAMFAGKDLAALGISPSVTFNLGPTLILGYNLQMDMSKDTGDHTMTNTIYAGLNLAF